MKLGILGHNIGYTASPTLHQSAAEQLGIQLEYPIYDIPPTEIMDFLEGFFQNPENQGLNITQPYKQLVQTLFGHPTPVNCLYKESGEFKATSTDGAGFYQALDHLENPESFNKVVILGNGGASKSIQEYLKVHRPELDLVCLTRPLSLETVEEAIKNNQDCLLIHATSAYRKGEDLNHLIPALKNFTGAFMDLDYNPASALFEACNNLNIRCIEGTPMLIEQGRLCQELWWQNKSGCYDKISKALQLS